MTSLMAALWGLLFSCLAWAAPGPFVTTLPDSTTTTQPASMEPLLSWFTGEFSSREQASYDSRFTSAELRLVEIWPGYKGFRWVYAEQFLTERAVRPFRQRIYRFSLVPDGRILMAELTMPRAIDFAGAWRRPELLDSLTPQQLSLRQGCEIWLTRQPSGEYAGHSKVGSCSTNFGGASTLVQYLWIGPHSVRLLDRAYDTDAHQRWGSPGEGYVYLRRVKQRGE
ncbi:TPA: chromophore lyase CpcT/CpeT [Aeromonas dhakensis]|uniref:chromophore lyase CpcT/CpeT n=1 Tax=Aeromonas dhakensis TaxID=196024 RepID=UPI001F606DB3|nr:chromophore lyase CpcT/CpeT [Aeromonas dhakensis]HCT2505584.1 chromophore lyase CpcT/CpeT [Aeromonas dhakensis]HDX8590714.1 chromophore lyase CpcT/CpeT [Aeromonas dhakensis]HDZ8895578.1 chromophore lyase CpcT/CpeT [Aeromonas dhakensis]